MTFFRTSVTLSPRLHAQMRETMEGQGYNQKKEQSRWICEAIRLLVDTDASGLAGITVGEALEQRSVRIPLHLDEDAYDAIQRGVAIFRRLAPGEEGVRSALIRASVRERIAKYNSGNRKTSRIQSKYLKV